MDWVRMFLDFFASVAWPAVVIVAVLTFRRQIAGLIDEIDEATGWGAKLKLKRGDKKAEAAKNAEYTLPGVETESRPAVEAGPDALGQSIPAPGVTRLSRSERYDDHTEAWRVADTLPGTLQALAELRGTLPTSIARVRRLGVEDAVLNVERAVDIGYGLCFGRFGDDPNPLLPQWYRRTANELISISEAVRDGEVALSPNGVVDYATAADKFMESLIKEVEHYIAYKSPA